MMGLGFRVTASPGDADHDALSVGALRRMMSRGEGCLLQKGSRGSGSRRCLNGRAGARSRCDRKDGHGRVRAYALSSWGRPTAKRLTETPRAGSCRHTGAAARDGAVSEHTVFSILGFGRCGGARVRAHLHPSLRGARGAAGRLAGQPPGDVRPGAGWARLQLLLRGQEASRKQLMRFLVLRSSLSIIDPLFKPCLRAHT